MIVGMSGYDGAQRRSRLQRASALLASSTSIALAVLLSGCTSGDGYPIFDREVEPSDAPPAGLADQDLHGIDLDTLRLAAEYEGDRLYLARSDGPDGGICLLVDGPETDGVTTACSGGGWVGWEGHREYHVHPEGMPSPGDLDLDLTENISVRTG